MHLACGHLMTLAEPLHYMLFHRFDSWEVKYEREFIQTEDSGELALDWSYPKGFSQISPQIKSKILCLIPGITGHSEHVYCLNTTLAANSKNIVMCIMNHRGTPGTPVKSPKLYDASSSQDV